MNETAIEQATEAAKICPFCPLWGIAEEDYELIGDGVQGDDFFGHPASVQGIRCCGACELAMAGMPEDEQAEMVALVLLAGQVVESSDSEVAR